jgi:hypothetical protein
MPKKRKRRRRKKKKKNSCSRQIAVLDFFRSTSPSNVLLDTRDDNTDGQPTLQEKVPLPSVVNFLISDFSNFFRKCRNIFFLLNTLPGTTLPILT